MREQPGAGQARGILLLIIGICVAVMALFGARKAGFHEDEAYSYYSTNRTAGLYYPDREWVDRETILREFTAQPGDGPNFSGIREVQSWDVHPPLYYFLLRIACLASPGVFSKWQGIAVNLIGAALLLAAVYALGEALGEASGFSPGKRRLSGLFAALLAGLSPAAVSGAVFIRMYIWLSLFCVLLCLWSLRFLRAVERGDKRERIRALLLLGAAGALGFLTQYYAVILMAGLGLFVLIRAYCCARRQERWRVLFSYVLVQGAFLSAAVLYYPASLSHILKGYRGKEAVSSFLDSGNLIERLSYFGRLLRDQVLGGGAGLPAALVLLLLGVFFLARKRAGASFAVLALSCLFYFAVVSKTALLLGESSIRYILPLCPVLCVLLVTCAFSVPAWEEGKPWGAPVLALLCMILILNCIRLPGRVLFLYPEDGEKIAREREAEGPAVVAFNPASPYNLWFLTDEVLDRPSLYFMDETDTEPLGEEAISGAGDLLVFLQDGEGSGACLELLKEGAGFSREEELLHREEMWSVYLLRGAE